LRVESERGLREAFLERCDGLWAMRNLWVTAPFWDHFSFSWVSFRVGGSLLTWSERGKETGRGKADIPNMWDKSFMEASVGGGGGGPGTRFGILLAVDTDGPGFVALQG
jgi:hypothetical protein